MHMCNAETNKGQQKVQILKKRTVLCPSRRYYSMPTTVTSLARISKPIYYITSFFSNFLLVFI